MAILELLPPMLLLVTVTDFASVDSEVIMSSLYFMAILELLPPMLLLVTVTAFTAVDSEFIMNSLYLNGHTGAAAPDAAVGNSNSFHCC